MGREVKRQNKKENRKRRRHGIRSTFAVAAAVLTVFLLGALAGVTGFWKLVLDGGSHRFSVFTVTALEEQGFVPLDTILRLDGYTAAEPGEDTAAVYRKETPEIVLEIENNLEWINKNSYTFSVQDQLIELNGRFYIQREALEEIINKKICMDAQGAYRLEQEAQEAHAWFLAEMPLIAHAGGGILEKQEDGKWKRFTYTNSLEAFISSYDRGYRVIEMDFQLSTDDVLCGLHDWDEYEGVLSSSKWKEQKIKNRYTTMVFSDVLAEMAVNLDLYVVLDLKSYEWEADEVVRQYRKIYEEAKAYGGDQLADRLIPQIYRQEEYDLIRSVHPWKSIIYTLYRSDQVVDADIVSFVEEKEDIRIVTVPKRRISEEFCTLLHNAGKLVYTHTINDTDGVYTYMNDGVDGFYTDTMTPAGFQARYDRM